MHIAAVIYALPSVPCQFRVSDSRFIHSAVLSTLSTISPETAKALHDAQRHKLFSLAMLPQKDPVVRLRVVFHSEAGMEFFRILSKAFSRNSKLQLGPTECEVQKVDITPSEWSGVAGWADLLDGSTSQHITLQFVTSTAIMKEDGSGRRYSSLYPEPVDVFHNLLRRWVSLGGPSLTPDLVESLHSAGCIISRYELQTAVFPSPERLQVGFRGSVTYELRYSNPAFVQSMCALARLAHYTGVGYQTTRGMGLVQTRIEG